MCFLGLFLSVATSRTALAAEKSRLRADDYKIDVELLPQTHKLTARATVTVTALDNLTVATFQLNNALRITKLTDANNKALTPERNTQDSTVRFSLNSDLPKNTTTTFNFEYEGTLESADESPVEGLKLAYVGPRPATCSIPACGFRSRDTASTGSLRPSALPSRRTWW